MEAHLRTLKTIMHPGTKTENRAGNVCASESPVIQLKLVKVLHFTTSIREFDLGKPEAISLSELFFYLFVVVFFFPFQTS